MFHYFGLLNKNGVKVRFFWDRRIAYLGQLYLANFWCFRVGMVHGRNILFYLAFRRQLQQSSQTHSNILLLSQMILAIFLLRRRFLTGSKLLYQIWPHRLFFCTAIFISFESLGMYKSASIRFFSIIEQKYV
mgnify:CR=1 FL=1